MTAEKIINGVVLVVPWTIAIVAVTGTLALVIWIVSMIVKKDPPK